MARSQRSHIATCPLCEAMCGILVGIQGQRVVSVRGDPEDPFSRGYICPKGTALADLHHDPDRLREPMERSGGQWRAIAWRTALDRTAESLLESQRAGGRDAVATYLGNPNVHNYGSLLFLPPLLRALRTRNRYSATSVDQLPHHLVAWKLFGHQLLLPVPDLDRTGFLLIMGGNPLASNGSLMTAPDMRRRLQAIQARGGRIEVVDPRRTETVELADRHHPVRPASDACLLLAMLHVIVEEGLVRPGAARAYLHDADAIGPLVADWTPARVAGVTGLPEQEIIGLARRFAAAERAVCYARMGLSTQAFGTLCQWLVALLNILTGRLDAPGGIMFTTPAVDLVAVAGSLGGGGHFQRYHSRVRGLPEFGGELPVATLADEILTPGPGQVRSLLSFAGNPVLSTPAGQRLDEALAGLDFMAAVDFYVNETTRHAHLILPPPGPLEREHYDLVFHMLAVRNTAKYVPPAFPAPPGTRPEWWIAKQLQSRLLRARPGAGRWLRAVQAPLSPPRLLDWLLRTGPHGRGYRPLGRGLSLKGLRRHPHGLDLGALVPCLPERLHTPDRRIRLVHKLFMAQLPRLAEWTRNDGPAMVLIGRRHLRSNNSWMHNCQRLVKGPVRCTVMVHPRDAARLGLRDGADAELESAAGRIRLPVEITDAVIPGVVSVPHGWGHDRADTGQRVAATRPGASINDLTDPALLDEPTGTAVLNGVPVTVARAS